MAESFAGTQRFDLRRRLGEGGMGVVYEAYDRERKAVVALKTLRHLDAQSVLLFKNEFRALQDIHHANLVTLGELICEGEQWFFTMDLVEGTGFLTYVRPQVATGLGDLAHAHTMDLATAVPATPAAGHFDEVRLRDAFRQLADAVAALHAAGKIHRDLKPSNIRVTPEGRVVVMDFGLVAEFGRHTPQKLLDDEGIVGTAAYMSPEQGAGKECGPAADWYAVGIILYEALTGTLPFTGNPIEILSEKQDAPAPSPAVLVPDAPEDLVRLCTRLLHADPRQRPPGLEVLARLGVEADEQPGPATSSGGRKYFVGRTPEMAVMHEAFADTRRGTGSAVALFVRGHSGVGKSTLVRHQLSTLMVDQPTSLVLAGRCYERESVPYKAFDGVMDALAAHLTGLRPDCLEKVVAPELALLARIFPVLRRVPTVAASYDQLRDGADPQERRTRAFAALRRLLQQLSARHPLVLFIDDFQWADADSLALLGEILAPPDPPSLLLVATTRSDIPGSTGVLETPILPLTDVREIEVKPLDVSEALNLARKLMGQLNPKWQGSLSRLAHEAGGHPLFIYELVRHTATSDAEIGRTPKLDDAIFDRIQRLDEPCRRLLQVVCVSGVPISQEAAALASGMSMGETMKWISRLRLENLVRTSGTRGSDTVEAYHDRVRVTVAGRMAVKNIVATHGLLAEALATTGASSTDPLSLVHHLEAAGEKHRATRYALDAASQAMEALAFDRAARLYASVLELGQLPAAEARNIRVQLGHALTHAGRGAEAATVYLGTLAGADAGLRLDLQRRAAEQLLVSGHIERGLETYGDVLREIDVTLPASPRAALLSLLWNRGFSRLRGLKWTARDASEIPPRDLVKVDVYEGVSVGLSLVDPIRGADFQARALRKALETGEPGRVGRALAFEAVHHATQGMDSMSRCQALLDEARDIQRRFPSPLLEGWVMIADAAACYFSGRFDEAARRCPIAEQQLLAHASGAGSWELNINRTFQMLALRHMGHWGELHRLYGLRFRDAVRRGDRYAETSFRNVCSVVWLGAGRPDAMRQELDRTTWEPPEGGFHVQHWYELWARLELALYEGTFEQEQGRLAEGFRGLKQSLLPRVRTIKLIAAWLEARLLLARAESKPDEALLVEAERRGTLLRADSLPMAGVWAGLIEAAVMVRRSRHDDAVLILERVERDARDRGIPLCAEVARWRRGELLGGDGGDELMDAAEAWMSSQQIRNPGGVARVIAPGFI